MFDGFCDDDGAKLSIGLSLGFWDGSQLGKGRVRSQKGLRDGRLLGFALGSIVSLGLGSTSTPVVGYK